jgi:hypothetical protein
MSHGCSSTTPSPNDKAIIGKKLIFPTEESMNVMVLNTDYALFFNTDVIVHYKYLLEGQTVNQDL